VEKALITYSEILDTYQRFDSLCGGRLEVLWVLFMPEASNLGLSCTQEEARALLEPR
jgi:hypothetical protein